MDDKKKPENGTYTQVPNVFFDTCDLPESAQILYLRLYRHIAYKDERKFTGSIRKLSSLARLSKSTVERMTKILEESRLISISYESSQEQDRKIMTITINPQELWLLNKQHYEDNDVPIWDKVMPVVKVLSQIGTLCPDMGQDTINLGQNNVNLGQTVPDASSKSAQESISTTNDFEEREKDSEAPTSQQTPNVSTGDSPSHSFIHSQNQSLVSSQQTTKPDAKPSVVFSPEAEQIYQFAMRLDLVALKRDEDHKGYCDTLVGKGITTLEDFEKLLQYCEQLPIFANKTDKKICLKNLINALPGWLQLQRRSTAAPSTSVVVSTMAKATAELLAKEEETKRRILAQEAAKGQRPMRPSERILAAQSTKVSPEAAEKPDNSSEQPMPDQQQLIQPSASANEHPTPDQEQPMQPARPKYGPKLDGPPVYQRLETKRPAARQRSAWARQQAAKEAQEGAMK